MIKIFRGLMAGSSYERTLTRTGVRARGVYHFVGPNMTSLIISTKCICAELAIAHIHSDRPTDQKSHTAPRFLFNFSHSAGRQQKYEISGDVKNLFSCKNIIKSEWPRFRIEHLHFSLAINASTN